MAQKLLGTLKIFSSHGAGNPREFFSVRPPSLLKFQSLKLKGWAEEKGHRYRIGKGAGMLHKW
ncbi:hypothetical protein TU87_21330 [Pseudomonas weihenstephanensis]|nr:hypothetical protein TU87_21330 [Pseudomonas weihenstephanensis]